MPPFDGPRATLCVTRCPWKTRVVPSSIDTGIETETAFLQSWRTLTRFESIAKASATRRSCSRAISNGFSRRCETGASTVVTAYRVYGDSAERKRQPLPARRARLHRIADDPEHVRARRQPLSVGTPARETERVAARQHVTEP